LLAGTVGWLRGLLAKNFWWSLACQAPKLDPPATPGPGLPDGRGLKIGYLRDSAFTFYYTENLETLIVAGAELVSISAFSAASLPEDLDALGIGGGFPETHGEALPFQQPLQM